ncbi:uncharacterized protein LOC144212125 isoform X1 [Stigmatopora nigra]
MEGQGDSRRSGYRIPLDLGREEANLRFRRFSISLHSDEIAFIIEASPRQPPNDHDRNEDDAYIRNNANEVNRQDGDGDNVPQDSNSEHELDGDGDGDAEDTEDGDGDAEDTEDGDGDGDAEENNEDADSDAQNEDSDVDLMLEDNEELYNFVNARDQYAWIRFIWQVWPFSFGNIFEEIVFEFQGIREEDVAIRDYGIMQENADDNDQNALNDDDGNNADVEDAADDSDSEVGVNQPLEQVDEHPLPLPFPLPLSLPLPVPVVPNVRSKVEESDEEAFRWLHDFDYHVSESLGPEGEEEDPGCDKKLRDNTQDGRKERKLGLQLCNEPDRSIRNSHLVSEESGNITCFSEFEAETEVLAGPSRKRSREEAGLNQERRSSKRLCRRAECEGKTFDGSAEDVISGAKKRS